MRVSKSYYIFIFFIFITIPFGFLIRVFYSRTLTPDQLGIFYSIFNFLSFFSVFTFLGLNSSFSYFVPKYLVRKDYNKVKNTFYFIIISNFLLTLISTLFLYLLSNFISLHYFHNPKILKYFRVFLLFFFFNNLLILSHFYIALRKNIIYQGLNFINLIFTFILSVIIYFLKRELLINYILVKGFVVFLIYILYIFITFKSFSYLRQKPNLDKDLFKKIIKYSLSLFISGLGLTIFSTTDIFVITYFLKSSMVAYYSNSLSLINIFISIFGALSILLMPLFSELKEKNKKKYIKKIIDIVYYTFIFFIFPVTLILFIYPDLIIKLVFGIKYLEASNILRMFSFFIIFKILLTYNISFMNGLGLGNKTPKIILPIALFNLLFNLGFINIFGIYSVIVSTILSWIFLTYFTYKEISKDINYKLKFRKYFSTFFLGVLFIGLVLFFKNFFSVANFYIKSLLTLIISYFIYIILGNIFKVYSLNDILILIPSEKLSMKIKSLTKKYFRFIN